MVENFNLLDMQRHISTRRLSQRPPRLDSNKIQGRPHRRAPGIRLPLPAHGPLQSLGDRANPRGKATCSSPCQERGRALSSDRGAAGSPSLEGDAARRRAHGLRRGRRSHGLWCGECQAQAAGMAGLAGSLGSAWGGAREESGSRVRRPRLASRARSLAASGLSVVRSFSP